MDWARMKLLINRLPAAKCRMVEAKSYAYRAATSYMTRAGGHAAAEARGAAAIEMAKAQYCALVDELSALRAQAEPMIASLPDTLEQDAMRLRYMEGLSALEVSFRLNYSVQHIFRILARAEKKLA